MIGLDQERKKVVANSDPVEDLEMFWLIVRVLTILYFMKWNRKQFYQSRQLSVKWRKDFNCFVLVSKCSLNLRPKEIEN